MKLLTKIVLVLTFAGSANYCAAQDSTYVDFSKPKKKFWDRVFLSPDLGLQFGTVTVVNVAPKFGYFITDRLSAGLGGTYIYLKDKRYTNFVYETNIYGGSVFSQYQLFESVRTHVEYELLNAEVYDNSIVALKRKNIESLLVGGGYSQPIGERSSFVIMGLWNLLENRYSFYQNPIIRVGFNFGF